MSASNQFALLDRREQHLAIIRLSLSGYSDYTCASITGLTIEMIRRILREQQESVP